MKSILTALLLSISLIFSSGMTSSAQDFQKGAEAYQSGDFATALKEWVPLAERGNAVAQYNLGLMYANGQGVVQDGKQAAKWYRKAAEQGLTEAPSKQGFCWTV